MNGLKIAVHDTDSAIYGVKKETERPVISLGELKNNVSMLPVRCAGYSLKSLLERNVEMVTFVTITEFDCICLHMSGKVVYESDMPGKIEEMRIHYVGDFPDIRHLVVRLNGNNGPVFQMSCFSDDVGICILENESKDDSILMIMVFADGIVYYRNGARESIFSLNKCREYKYESVDDSLVPEVVDIDAIEWHLGLIMFGEEKIIKNVERHSKTVPFCSENEYGRDICDCDSNIWNSYVDEYMRRNRQIDLVNDVTACLKDRDRRILELYYVHDEREEAIAEILGISRKTVSRRLIKMRSVLKMRTCVSE